MKKFLLYFSYSLEDENFFPHSFWTLLQVNGSNGYQVSITRKSDQKNNRFGLARIKTFFLEKQPSIFFASRFQIFELRF